MQNASYSQDNSVHVENIYLSFLQLQLLHQFFRVVNFVKGLTGRKFFWKRFLSNLKYLTEFQEKNECKKSDYVDEHYLLIWESCVKDLYFVFANSLEK